MNDKDHLVGQLTRVQGPSRPWLLAVIMILCESEGGGEIENELHEIESEDDGEIESELHESESEDDGEL